MPICDKPEGIFDVAVLGAGPAGLCCASKLLNLNPKASVLLLDRQHPGTEPVACAEAVPSKLFEELVPFWNRDWIRGEINGCLFVSANGTRADLESLRCGYLIHRAKFHSDLASLCIERGAMVGLQHTVRQIENQSDGVRKVIYTSQGEEGSFKAKYIVDATGPGSRFGENEGLVSAFFDREPALFAVVEGVEFPVDRIQLWFGKNYAPGGYAWLFPQGSGVANIGLVVGVEESKNFSIRQGLNNLLAQYFPEGKVLYTKGGAISCGGSSAILGKKGLLKAGDAASMVHPLTRGGIVESMKAGTLLAELLAKRLVGAISEEQLYASYQGQWNAFAGHAQRQAYLAKSAFKEIPDRIYNTAAHKLSLLPAKKRTTTRIFITTLLNYPILLWRLKSMFLN